MVKFFNLPVLQFHFLSSSNSIILTLLILFLVPLESPLFFESIMELTESDLLHLIQNMWQKNLCMKMELNENKYITMLINPVYLNTKLYSTNNICHKI